MIIVQWAQNPFVIIKAPIVGHVASRPSGSLVFWVKSLGFYGLGFRDVGLEVLRFMGSSKVVVCLNVCDGLRVSGLAFRILTLGGLGIA